MVESCFTVMNDIRLSTTPATKFKLTQKLYCKH